MKGDLSWNNLNAESAEINQAITEPTWKVIIFSG